MAAETEKLKDIKSMSTEDLKSLWGKIDVELKRREEKEKAEARRNIVEIANMHDINLSDLARKERQYRNPDNQWQTWNGKGRKPKWVKEWVDKGRSLEELEIS